MGILRALKVLFEKEYEGMSEARRNMIFGDPPPSFEDIFSREVLRESIDGNAKQIMYGDIHIGFEVTTKAWNTAIFNDFFYFKRLIKKPSYFNGYKPSFEYIKRATNKHDVFGNFSESAIESVRVEIKIDEMQYDMELISEQEYMEATEK